jgi:hypothetical protein
MRRSLKTILASLFLGFLFSLLGQGSAWGQERRLTQPIDEARRVTLRGSVHPLARAKYDQGAAPDELGLKRMLLVLSRSQSQEIALRQLLEEQQTPGSENYRRWLSPAEFGARFGASDDDVAVVTSWLAGHGLQVDHVAQSRGVIEFSGTAARVREAFQTQIHKYMVGGEAHWANATDPRIPSALAPVVAGFASLNNFGRKHFAVNKGKFVRDQATGEMHPAFTLTSSNGAYYGLGAGDFATIYNSKPLLQAGNDGTGRTIAIVGQTNINQQDVTDFRNLFGLSTTPDNHTTVIVNGPDPGINSDEIEADLDVQWANATAPGAQVTLVTSESTETTSGVDLSALYIVDNNLADVMSESYGACELFMGTGGNQFYQQLWQQASAQGITVAVSSGDSGSAGCDDPNFEYQAQYGLAVSGIASTPYNVAVGGTDFNDGTKLTTYWSATNGTGFTSAKSYIPEMTWNDSCASTATAGKLNTCPALTATPAASLQLWSGSGGPSNCSVSTQAGACTSGTPKPAWQTGAGVPADGVRDIPDVSFFAAAGGGSSRSFYVVCNAAILGYPGCSNPTYQVSVLAVGGTSASSPSFAGIMALADQKVGTRLGNVNYLLYAAAAKTGASCASSGTPGAGCVFYDTTVGNIAVPCVPGSPNCSASSTTGVTVTSANAPAYVTKAGYDLATGLGSANVTNLVSAIANTTFNASAVTLKLNGATSAVTIQHGTSVDLSVGVTPTAATGTVGVLGATNNAISSAALASGAAAWSSRMFPGGNYNVHAHYAGNGTYGASDSSTVAVNVTPEASKILLNMETFDDNGYLISWSANSATYGSGYQLLRLDVGDSAASMSLTNGPSSNCFFQVTSCPTGSVNLTNSGTAPMLPSSLALNSVGYAEDQAPVPGTYAITASYGGDASYAASTGTGAFTIGKGPTSLTAGFQGTPQYAIATVLTAQISTSSNGVGPDGSVAWYDNGNLLASGLVSGSSANSLVSPPQAASGTSIGVGHFLSVGTHLLTAQYTGDAYYEASTTTASVTVNVVKAIPSFGYWTVTPFNPPWNTPVTLTTILYGAQGGVTPTGTITFSEGGTTIPGTVNYSQAGGNSLQASIQYSSNLPGTHQINLAYSGDGNYTSTTNGYQVTIAGPVSLSVQGSALIVPAPGQSGTADLTITPSGTFTGVVTLTCTPDPAAKETTCGFVDGSTTSSSLDVNVSGGNATATVKVTTTAPHTVTARKLELFRNDGERIALGCLVLLAIPMVRRKSRLALLIGMLTLGMLFTACGGGSSKTTQPPPVRDPGTSLGSYSFTITATAQVGGSTVTTSAPLTVTVQ